MVRSCPAADTVAASLNLPTCGLPVFGGRYIVVVPDAAGLELVSSADERGYSVVASVAWRLSSPLVARLAAIAVPVIVGLPSPKALDDAIERGNTESMRSTIARWVVAESYFARPPAISPKPYALTAPAASPARGES